MPAVHRSASHRDPRYAEVARRPSRAEVRRDNAGDVIEDQDGDDDEDEAGEQNDHTHAEGDESDQRGPPSKQPLRSSASMSVQEIIKDYDTSIAAVGVTRNIISDAAVEWAELTQDPGQKGERLDHDFRDMIDAEVEMRIRQKALAAIKEAVATGQAVLDPVEQYNALVNEALEKYSKQTTRQKYLKDNEYKAFAELVWEAHKEEAMPPLQDFLPAEEGDISDEDDFAVGGMVQDFKCPLTMATLDQPMTSTTCRHSYSKEAVFSYIEQCAQRRERPQCPRAGCDKQISKTTLREDPELEKRVRAHKRRMEQREGMRRTQASAIID